MLYNQISKQVKSIAIVLAIVLIASTSCEDKVIDLNPVDKIPDLTAYDTPERCEQSVVGAYDAAQNGRYNNSYSRGYPFGSASIIQGEMRGEDMNLTAAFYEITYSSTYTTATANNQFYWETSFECINRVNIVLKGIESAVTKGVISKEKGNQYRGELLFLRALTYHYLLIHFALPYNVQGNNNYGLPLYLTPNNTLEEIETALKTGRSTVEQTYTQILKDLDEAESLFADNNKNSVNGITRVSKGTVIALKTRVYLHKRDWEGVKKEAAKLVNGGTAPFKSPVGNYELTESPATPFVSYSNNSESVFSIENTSSDEPGVNGALASITSIRVGGRGILTSSPTLYNSSYWLGDDKRRNLVIYQENDQYYYCDKYQKTQTREEYTPLIRYAEVLLNYAEAALRANPSNKTLALELLNAVRNRSLADPATQAYTISRFSTDKDFLNAILWERRIEFHGEGRRWEDIHRLANDDILPSGGIPAKIEYGSTRNKGAFVVNGEVKNEWFAPSRKFIPYTDKRFIWPVPVNDLIRNPTLAAQQNAGW